MQCQTFHNRLQELLDERQCPERDVELAQHAARCDACRGMLAGQYALFAGLAQLSAPPLAADFADRTVRRLTKEYPGAPTAPARYWAWVAVGAVATAAAVLLALSPGWGLRQPARSDLAALHPSDIQSKTDMATTDPLLYEQRIRQWVHTLPVEQWEEVDYQVVEAYAPGLRSLRISLALAFDTLRRSLPGHREMPKSEGAQRHSLHLAPA